jgi:acyl-CoA thioesterase-1
LHPYLLFLLALLLLLAGCSLGAQPAGPAHVVAPTDASPARFTYVALGASDAFGVGASDPTTQSWPADLAQELPSDTRFVNLGIPGVTLHQALAQELPVALSVHPNLVTIWLGVNDLDDNVPLGQYQQDLNTLLTTLATRTHATVAVGNIPNLTFLPAFANQDPATLQAKVAAWNQVIATAVANHHALLVDLYQGTAAFATNPQDISSDGLHPTEQGYQLIATAFAQVLRAHQIIR